jgi:hypothetical protein
VEAQGTWSGGIVRSIAVMASRSAAGRSGAGEVGGRGGGSTVADASEASFAGGRPRQSAGKRRLAAMISCSLPEDPVREDKKKVRNKWWDPYLCVFFHHTRGTRVKHGKRGMEEADPPGALHHFPYFFHPVFFTWSTLFQIYTLLECLFFSVSQVFLLCLGEALRA